MAAAHVSAAAALVLGAGVLGSDDQPSEVESRLKCTARPVPGDHFHCGAGLLDAGQATSPTVLCP